MEMVRAVVAPAVGSVIQTVREHAISMCGVRPALFPAVPKLSYFLECNVRTYVFDAQGRPGIWFCGTTISSTPSPSRSTASGMGWAL